MMKNHKNKQEDDQRLVQVVNLENIKPGDLDSMIDKSFKVNRLLNALDNEEAEAKASTKN